MSFAGYGGFAVIAAITGQRREARMCPGCYAQIY
jgi:hypothetical protein